MPKLTKTQFKALEPQAAKDHLETISLRDFNDLNLTPADVVPIVEEVLRKELTEPQYVTLTDQEAANALNAPVEREIETQVVESARMAVIVQEVIGTGKFVTDQNFTTDGQGNISIENVDLQSAIKQAIEEEIKTDPLKRGYAGKSREEVMQMLRAATVKVTKTIEVRPCRFNQITKGVALAPNAATAQMIAAARSKNGK